MCDYNLSDTGHYTFNIAFRENKTVVDLLFGVTQVLSRKSLLQLNYTLGSNSGYLTDPYKLLSVIDDNQASPDYGEIINQGTAGDGYSYRHENRPDSRLSHAIYAKYIRQLEEDVINFSYRYFFDDWGITSHTMAQRWSKMYDMKIEARDVYCNGCKSLGTQGIYCQTMCRIKPCCREKGLDTCAPCPEFPCDDLKKVFEFCPEAKKRLMDD